MAQTDNALRPNRDLRTTSASIGRTVQQPLTGTLGTGSEARPSVLRGRHCSSAIWVWRGASPAGSGLADGGNRVALPRLDWAEPMLERARAKAAAAGVAVTFLQADAEHTMLPAGSQDVIVTRHLVWTLVDPAAAFAEWFRVLAPGGQLLVVDGDFVSRGWVGSLLSRLLGTSRTTAADAMAHRHAEILSRVHFSAGARAEKVAELLYAAGFTKVRIDTAFGAIHRAQAAEVGWKRALLRRSEHRYAISPCRP